MSKPPSQQEENRARYVEAAAQLKLEVMRTVRKFPHNWKNNVTKDLVETARACHKACTIANAIYESTPREFEDKIALLNEAIGLCEYLGITLDEVYRADPYKYREVKDANGVMVMEKDYFFTETRMVETTKKLAQNQSSTHAAVEQQPNHLWQLAEASCDVFALPLPRPARLAYKR